MWDDLIRLQIVFGFCFGAGAAACIPLTRVAQRWADRSRNWNVQKLPGLSVGLGVYLALGVLLGFIAPGANRLAWVGSGVVGFAAVFALWRCMRHYRRLPLPAQPS